MLKKCPRGTLHFTKASAQRLGHLDLSNNHFMDSFRASNLILIFDAWWLGNCSGRALYIPIFLRNPRTCDIVNKPVDSLRMPHFWSMCWSGKRNFKSCKLSCSLNSQCTASMSVLSILSMALHCPLVLALKSGARQLESCSSLMDILGSK